MLVFFGSLVALATGTPGPSQVVIWPDGQEAVPVDTVVYLRETGSDLPDPTLARDDGTPVPFASVLLQGTDGLGWRMLVPEAALAPGGYTVATSGPPVGFTVEDRLADPIGPPSPYRRWTSSDCEGEAELSYRVCGGGILHLAAVGDTEPAAPDLASVVVIGAGEDTLRLLGNLGVDAGFDGTVWIGSLDEAGRFGGWWPGDPVVLPEPGVYTIEAPSGTTASPGSTVTSIGACPAFSGWEQLDAVDCTGAEVVVKTETEKGCGCRTPGSLAGGWALGLLFVRVRGRRSRSCGSAAPRRA